MATNGTSFSIDIAANAGSAVAAAAAVQNLAAQLEAAEAASTAAADAVRAGEASYAAAQVAADRAALAVEKIGQAAAAQRGKLEEAMNAGDPEKFWKIAGAVQALEQKQAAAAEKATAAKAALDAEAAALDKLKASAAKAAQSQEQVAKAHEAAEKASKQQDAAARASAGSGKVNEIAEGLGKLGGPLGTTGQKLLGAAEGFKKLGGSLGSAGPYVAVAVAIAAIAAAVVAVSAAAIVGLAQITAWSVGLADAARTQNLLAAGIARTVEGGKQLTAKIDDLTGKVPLSREKLMGLAKTLGDSGLRGKQLTDALQTAAVKAAKLEFGPNFQEQLFSLPSQAERLKANISKLFQVSQPKLDKFLHALDRFGELFEENNAAAKAIKVVFQDIFDRILDGATATIPKLRTGFINAQIVILKGLIQLKKFTQEWGDTLRLAAKVVGVLALIVGGVLLLAIGAVVASLTLMSIGIATLLALVGGLIVSIGLIGATFIEFGVSVITGAYDAVKKVVDFLQNTSLASIGTAMVEGLAAGITAAGSKVLSALKGVVDGAVGGAKKALGIASPSKVFEEIGGFTAEGMAGGVADGTADVKSAVSDMVAPPPPQPAAPAAPAAAPQEGGGGGGVIIQIYGVKGAEDLLEELQKIAIQLGGAVPAT